MGFVRHATRRNSRARARRLGFAVIVGVWLGSAVPAAGAADFTWNGNGPTDASHSSTFSAGADWTGGIGPTGSVDRLVFPALPQAECAGAHPTIACYAGENDSSNLATGAIAIDSGAPYVLGGSPVTLGGGGLTSAQQTAGAVAEIFFPIKLSAPQTWTIDGGHTNFNGLDLFGGLSGAFPLVINLQDAGSLALAASHNEVGPVTVSGQARGTTHLGTLTVANLNQADGSPLTLNNVTLTDTSTGSSVTTLGPLTTRSSSIIVGGALAVNGAITLDSGSELLFTVENAGPYPGVDYSQLTATGPVNLYGVSLRFAGACPPFDPGTTETLLTTSATLTGTFAGIGDGGEVALCPGSNSSPILRINYTANSVTATAVGTRNTRVPAMTGTPHASAAALTGLQANRPQLHFTLQAGRHAPAIKSLLIALPRGLRFIRPARGVALARAGIDALAVRGGRLLLALTKPSDRFTVRLTQTALAEAGSIRSAAKTAHRRAHRNRRLTVIVGVVDAKSSVTPLKLRLPLR